MALSAIMRGMHNDPYALGAFYRHEPTGELVQYAGRIALPDTGEPVEVFRLERAPRCVMFHDSAHAAQGDRFIATP